MKRILVMLVLATISLPVNSLMSHSGTKKFGIGLDVGVRRIYGDNTSVSLGPGLGGLLTYRVLPFADLALGVGYSQLRYNTGTADKTTNMYNFDMRTNVEFISRGLFRPYAMLGAGVLSSKSFNSTFVGAFFGGVGFKLHFSPKFDLFMGADYHFADSDGLDQSNSGPAKDGYFSVNSGFIYTLGSDYEESSPGVIAEERAPFYEVDDEPQYYDDSPETNTNVYGGGNKSKDMEEYVKLKSRVDRLIGNVDTRDTEIGDLRRRLAERKRKLALLETRAGRKKRQRLHKRSSMSGFSEIYEQALTNYYNKEYSEAVSLFRLLLQQYSNHSLVSSSQYWVGQCLFSMNRYREAIDEFYKVLSYDRSLKKDDSLFLLGKSYLKIGSGDRARESFVRLMQDHPHSEFVTEAKGYIARL